MNLNTAISIMKMVKAINDMLDKEIFCDCTFTSRDFKQFYPASLLNNLKSWRIVKVDHKEYFTIPERVEVAMRDNVGGNLYFHGNLKQVINEVMDSCGGADFSCRDVRFDKPIEAVRFYYSFDKAAAYNFLNSKWVNLARYKLSNVIERNDNYINDVNIRIYRMQAKASSKSRQNAICAEYLTC